MAQTSDDRDAEIARLRASNADLERRAMQAEDELRASRALHTALIESLPFPFWARDPDGVCTSQNAASRARWGNLTGKYAEEAPFPRQVFEVWRGRNRRALAGERVCEERTYDYDGVRMDVLGIVAPIRMGDAIIGTLGVSIDITQQRRALEALAESEEKLRLAVHAAGIGIFTWDLQSEAVTWDDALCAMCGITSDRAPTTAQEHMGYLYPGDRESTTARIARGVENGSWEGEFRVVRPDGATRWLLSCGKVLRQRGHEIAFGAVRDITERRERDERLRQAQKLEAVGQLTAGIAHNFNNMLMGILPNLELAQREAPSALAPLLKGAEQSAHRAAELVRQLMTFAGRKRRKEPAIEAVALIVDRALALCRTTFDRRIAFVTELDRAPRVRGDAGQLQQAILNLLINARDALDAPDIEKPCVTIDVGLVEVGAAELEGRDRDHVRVRVRDNGVGMNAETMTHLYEPFFTTKVVGKGTGIGLATTHAIVREHDGFIACTSAPGHGTTFSVYIPRDAALANRPETSPSQSARGTETILLVDDERMIRSTVSIILRDAGYSALTAASGEDALELLTEGRVGDDLRLVILDVSMPGMPSRVLRARLRELAPEAKVVYFTGYAWDASDTGDAVLEKPVSSAKLLATVRELLDRV